MDQRIAHHRHRRRNPMGSDSSNCEPAHYSPKKEKKLPLFSNTTLRNRTIFMIWIYKTDELHSIELALWWHYGCKYFQSKLECASSEKCENMTVVSKHLISVLSYRHWTLVRGDLRASSISTKTMRATNACGWKSGMRSLNHSLNHVLD